MRETVWSLSAVTVRKLRNTFPSTRGPVKGYAYGVTVVKLFAMSCSYAYRDNN